MNSKKRLSTFLIWVSVVFLQTIGFPMSAAAGKLTCSDVFTPGGAAVEMEMPISTAIVRILTTTNGKVGGLFPNEPLPLDYVKWAKQFAIGSDPREVLWDSVPDSMKYDLIREVSRNKKTTFFEDRRVPNIKVKDVIRLSFAEETSFFGTTYPAGTHDIDVSRYVGQVEYSNAGAQKDFLGVEVHLISKDRTAGQLVRDAWILQEAIGVNRGSLHEHVVAPIPLESLKRAPVLTSFSIAEYYRRINLLSEFIAVLSWRSIRTKKITTWRPRETVYFFDSINPDHLSTIFSYFADGINRGQKLFSFLKLGWVGFRGADFYDQPNLYGFEYRDLGDPNLAPLYSKVLDNLQVGMRSEDYGFTKNSVARWLSQKGVQSTEEVSSLLESSWYKHSYRELLRQLPQYLKPTLGNAVNRFFNVAALKMNARGNHAIRMLLHDWSSDFLFFDNPRGQQKVKEAQTRALERHLKHGVKLHEVAADFVWESGLLEKLAASFKLTPADFIEL